MAVPVVPPPPQLAAQDLQQKAADQAAQLKQTPSKFDAAMEASKGGAPGIEPIRMQEIHRADHVRNHKVQDTLKTTLRKELPPSETVGKISRALQGVESHWNQLEQVLKASLTKKLDMQSCIQLQVMAQKYSIELDLTGKVVEKAMNGLKDTLKTQV